MLAISTPTERELAVVEDEKALGGGAADVVVNDELIDLVLEQLEGPAAAADLLGFLSRQHRLPQAVAIGGIDLFNFLGGGGIRGFGHRRKAALGAIGVVATGIGPEDDGRAGVEELAADHDFIAAAVELLAHLC